MRACSVIFAVGCPGFRFIRWISWKMYCIAVGIRGEKQWKDHWVRRYRGMEEGSIEGINQIREQVWEKIGPFAEYMKEKEHTVEERTRNAL